MTFLNAALILGAFALVIPLVIHILNRSRFRTVEWGAMHLLESVIKVNHKRFQIEQLLLLFVRCAIPVLLALCLARPVLTGAQMLAGDAPVSLVILLDNSYSMDADGPGGVRFEQAIDSACEVVNATTRGSEICVILTGGKPTLLFDQPLFDASAVVQRLRQLKGGYGASDMPAALDEAVATLARMTHARRELIVISDFQPADWEVSEGTQAEAFRQQLTTLEIQPALTFLPIGNPITSNVAVESLEYSRRAIGVGQQLDVRANIRNFGNTAVENARVTLRIDGAESTVTQLNLAPNASTQSLFPCVFDSPDSHVIEVAVDAGDALVTDNRFAAAVNIWESVEVLLVDGDPSSQPLQSETDYLSIALTPLTFGRLRLADLVETQTISPSAITEELLSTARVVVLANVARLDDAQLAAIDSYTARGGALLVIAGNRIDLNWYRDRLYNNSQGLLPIPFGAPQGEIDGQGTASRLVAQHFDHPALEFFNVPANGDLSTAEIRRWYQLTVEPQARGDATEPVVLARLATGDPLLVEGKYGEGVVMQMATACDADWSDLPLRPFYVPLMQQIVTTLAAHIAPPRNLVTGDPAVAVLPFTEVETSLSMLTPDGSRRTIRTVPLGNAQLAQYDDTQRPGVYTLTLPSTEVIHFVAETSRSESNLHGLDEKRLSVLAESMSATLVPTTQSYLEQDRLRRHGREIWKYVLMLLLAFMFLELVLQQRFARFRT